MDSRWILIADASRARVFRENDQSDRYEILQTFEHEASRARSRDLMADTNGRKPGGPSLGAVHGGGRSVSHEVGRVGAAPDTEPKEVEAQKFARELAHYLEAQLNQHAYDKLMIAAPPHFLGLLRGCLSAQVDKHVQTTLNKDLTHLDTSSIRDHVIAAAQRA